MTNYKEEKSNFIYDTYKPGDTAVQAEASLRQQLSQKPGAYQSTWQAQLDETINKILNRETFSYDLNGDALYQQYKDNYIRQGQMAMMDTMGQAAALTGGYGNSYAQTAGQQAYQGYLQGLNDAVPELYQMALDQYNQEGQALYDQAALMTQMEDQDYGRYRDHLSDYYAELDRLTEDARYQSELDYSRWADGRDFAYGQFADDRAYNYQLSQDEFAKQEAAAQLMASKGDYSLLGQLYGLTDEQIAKLTPKTSPKTKSREEEIADWLASALANANGPSFDPKRLIEGTSYLKSNKERGIALDILEEYNNHS